MKKYCTEIQNLEERLACLEEKYSKLLKELETEREYIKVSDESGNCQDIENDIALLKREIVSTKNAIKAFELFSSDKKYTSATVGSKINLENHELCLTFLLVPEREASPAQGLVSINSPLGQAVMDKTIGEDVFVVSPKGRISYKIRGIA